MMNTNTNKNFTIPMNKDDLNDYIKNVAPVIFAIAYEIDLTADSMYPDDRYDAGLAIFDQPCPIVPTLPENPTKTQRDLFNSESTSYGHLNKEYRNNTTAQKKCKLDLTQAIKEHAALNNFFQAKEFDMKTATIADLWIMIQQFATFNDQEKERLKDSLGTKMSFNHESTYVEQINGIFAKTNKVVKTFIDIEESLPQSVLKSKLELSTANTVFAKTVENCFQLKINPNYDELKDAIMGQANYLDLNRLENTTTVQSKSTEETINNIVQEEKVKRKPQKKLFCEIHGKCAHSTEQCRSKGERNRSNGNNKSSDKKAIREAKQALDIAAAVTANLANAQSSPVKTSCILQQPLQSI
jgi:hypothetical protein